MASIFYFVPEAQVKAVDKLLGNCDQLRILNPAANEAEPQPQAGPRSLRPPKPSGKGIQQVTFQKCVKDNFNWLEIGLSADSYNNIPAVPTESIEDCRVREINGNGIFDPLLTSIFRTDEHDDIISMWETGKTTDHRRTVSAPACISPWRTSFFPAVGNAAAAFTPPVPAPAPIPPPPPIPAATLLSAQPSKAEVAAALAPAASPPPSVSALTPAWPKFTPAASTPPHSSPPSPPPAPAPAPSPKRKRSSEDTPHPPSKKTKTTGTTKRNEGAGTRWTDPVENQLIINLVTAELQKPNVVREKMWQPIAETMKTAGYHRSHNGIRNWWNRYGRELSGFDERRNKRPDAMATGLQHKDAPKPGRYKHDKTSQTLSTPQPDNGGGVEDSVSFLNAALSLHEQSSSPSMPEQAQR